MRWRQGRQHADRKILRHLAVEKPECASFDEAPIEEDWGFAVGVTTPPDTLLIGCANAFEADENVWRVMIPDNFLRGVLPTTRARKKASLAKLSDHIEQYLRADAEVSNVEVELGT